MAEIYINELNDLITSDPIGCVLEAERLYHGRISSIADYVTSHSDIRILLIAGPSGSGKTTTANLIKDAIASRGEEAIVVSLDDFYRDSSDPMYPRNDKGERDYECPGALHLEEISRTLDSIARGRAFDLPKYDFKVGARVSVTTHRPMPDGCVIVEGLHALNPAICAGIDGENCLKLFVSVSTNLENDSGERLLSGRKMRFVRRMVRDGLYRSARAERTVEMWRSVLAAEDVYLYPYRADADMAFDTFHTFELGVMKGYALDMISEELAANDEYVGAVASALKFVAPIDEALVPDDSLIREFIPGGKYEHLY